MQMLQALRTIGLPQGERCYIQRLQVLRTIGLPQGERYYIQRLQVLRTSVKCLLFAGLRCNWLFAGVMGY
jgi:CII-binding regulator of phage lambda lysogenization HflD